MYVYDVSPGKRGMSTYGPSELAGIKDGSLTDQNHNHIASSKTAHTQTNTAHVQT